MRFVKTIQTHCKRYKDLMRIGFERYSLVNYWKKLYQTPKSQKYIAPLIRWVRSDTTHQVVTVLVEVILVMAGLSLLTLAGLYLSGFILLLFTKKNPFDAELGTFYHYWHLVGGHPYFKKKLLISALLGLGSAYLLPLLIYLKAKSIKRSLYGDARFAYFDEIKKTGLLNGKGIVIGKWKDHYLMLEGQQFVLLAAPTRSGKGVSVVIPNLLSFQDSVVVLDIKLENYKRTAGFRKKHGQEIFFFSPFAKDFKSHRYNPLGYVRSGAFRIGDLQEIAAVLYPDTKKDDDFFPKQSRNMFVGIGLYLLETPELPCTLGEMLRQSSGKGMPVKDYLKSIIESRKKEKRPLSSECIDALNTVINLNETTQSSVIGSFQAPLTLWRNPILDAATSANDFDLRSIRKKRMSIYVGINPRQVPMAGVLITLFFAQLVSLNMEELPEDNPALKYQCLLIMDEFTSMGKIPVFADANAFIAGYNLRLLTIIQSLSQVASKYGPHDADTFLTNHALQILYAPKQLKDAKEYSEMLGYETVKGKSTSRQFSFNKSSQSESESDQKRALMLPQELRELGEKKAIIVLENSKPILCEKIKYYKDRIFKERLLTPPQVPELDMATHAARIENRVRVVELNDIQEGLNANQIVALTEKLNQLDPNDESPANLENFVMETVNALSIPACFFV